MLVEHINEVNARTTTGPRTVVIGSGAVGLYLANELAKRGSEVIVVESGGVNLGSFAPESYASVGAKHEGICIGRSRSLGGTTNLWGGQLVEFQPVDFAGRDWLPGSDWPVSYEEIAPFYKRTYENFGIEEEAQDDGRVWRHLLGETPKFNEGLEIFLTRWLNVPSFAVAFARQIHGSDNLRVLINHTAVGFMGVDGVISGVRIADRDGEICTVEGDRFILAAGTIESVRLLLHSAATMDWECPWRRNVNIGSHFQDHLGGRVALVQPKDRRAFFDTFSTMVWAGQKYQPKLRLSNEVLAQTRILNLQGIFAFESSVAEHLGYLKQFLKSAIYSRQVAGIRDLLVNLWGCGRYLAPLMWRYLIDNRIFVPGTSKISLTIQGEHVPLAESRLGIDSKSVDRNGMPRVILDWRLSGEELRSIRDFALRCDRALAAANLGRLELDEHLMNLDPRFMDTLRDTNHHAGGARMGKSSIDGVVDRNLLVFGTRNLYVAGAATFRSTGNANITLTALAFATRLVEHLSSEQHAVH